MSVLPPKLSKSDIHLLSVFITVVENGGFTAAQIPLNVSNSTISRQISDLEIRLGLRLCQRGRSGFQLTERGRLVYDAALDLFKAIEAFESDISILHDKPTGTLSFAVIENWASEKQPKLVEALRHFRDVAPDVYIDMHALPPDQIERGVLDGSISIGIGVFHNHKLPLIYQPIASETMGLYCSARHPLFQAKSLHEVQRLLRNAHFAERKYLSETMQAPLSKDMKITASAHQIECILLLILTGHFIGYLPDLFAHRWVETGQVKRIDGHEQSALVETVIKQRKSTPLVLNIFKKHLYRAFNATDYAADKPRKETASHRAQL